MGHFRDKNEFLPVLSHKLSILINMEQQSTHQLCFLGYTVLYRVWDIYKVLKGQLFFHYLAKKEIKKLTILKEVIVF